MNGINFPEAHSLPEATNHKSQSTLGKFSGGLLSGFGMTNKVGGFMRSSLLYLIGPRDS